MILKYPFHPIEFNAIGASSLSKQIKDISPSKVFVLCDENTYEHCWPLLAGTDGLEEAELLVIEPGEHNKNLETCHGLWDTLLNYNCDRKALLINLGGGVLTDMGGFIASTYKRGINFIQLPTTLLSSVDASVGGKLGIDHGVQKNMIGVFNYPEYLLIDTDFLKTLSPLEFQSGYFEMVKHGLIRSESHWNDLKEGLEPDAENLADLIMSSVKIKIDVTEEDPQEKGLRKILNYGHTIGHAIEGHLLQNGSPLPHGHCIGLGMLCENVIAKNKGLLSDEDYNEVLEYIAPKLPSVKFDLDELDEVLSLLGNDKKNEGGEILMSLISEIGKCEFNVSVSIEEARTSLETICR